MKYRGAGWPRRWAWRRTIDHNPFSPEHIVAEIFGFLAGQQRTLWRGYGNRRLAFADLNRAALLWAQTRATALASSS